MRRAATLALALLATLAAGATQALTRDPATCLKIFNDYDNAEWLYPQQYQLKEGGLSILQPEVGRPVRLLRVNGCLTFSDDLDPMQGLAPTLAGFTIQNSGAAIRPTALHLGIVTSFGDEARVTQFFRGLGYRSRGIGAEGLGRRLYIGPFTTQGALDQALQLAREAGFIAPYAATHTRF